MQNEGLNFASPKSCKLYLITYPCAGMVQSKVGKHCKYFLHTG